MTMTPGNIHIGAGTLTLNPDSSPISFESTQDGATLTYTGELEPIYVDQVLSPVGYFIPGEECKFEVLLVEADANTLRYALGATDQTVTDQSADADHKASTTINFGGNYILTDYVLEYSAKNRKVANCYAVVRLYIVNISPNLEAVYKKDGVTVYKLTLLAVADVTKDPGEQLGYYRHETADVTGTTATLAVSSTDPADSDSDVAITESIAIVFNRNVSSSSITEGNFVLMTDAGVEVAREVAYTGTGGTNVTVNPDASLANSTTYLLVISSEVRAADDNTKMAAPVIVDFTTVAP